MPGRGLSEPSGRPARTGFDVDAKDAGRGRGDSKMATAAWIGKLALADEEVPRTITWRLVDLRAVIRCEGGAAIMSQ